MAPDLAAAATTTFADPATWPGLPARRPVLMVAVHRRPSFGPWMAWAVLREARAKGAWVRRLGWQPGVPVGFGLPAAVQLDTFAAEAPATLELPDALLARFNETVRLGPLPADGGVGLDGVTWGLSVERAAAPRASLRLWWWEDGPPEWLGLGEVVALVRDRVEALLPPSRLDHPTRR